jgi:hypothetical protein
MGDSLMFFKAKVGIQPHTQTVRALLDSGATHTFVSTSVAEKLKTGAARIEDRQPIAVSLPNGDKLTTKASIRLPTRLGTWRGYISAWILDMKGYELVFGRDFLRKFNPSIDWKKSDMKIRDSQGTHLVPQCPTPYVSVHGDTQLNLISAKQCGRIMRKRGSETILMAIREAKQDAQGIKHQDAHVQQILDRYPDVLRPDLPDELPPERPIAHEIETNDAKPMNINAYPLSVEKLNEQAEQIDVLIKKGLIRPSSSPWGFPVIFAKKPNGLKPVTACSWILVAKTACRR